MLLRPSPDSVAVLRGAGKADLENDISVNEGSLRGFTPAPTRKPSIKNRVMSPPPTPLLMSPPPTPQLGTSTIREEKPTRNEVVTVEEKTEINNSVTKVPPPPPEAPVAEVVNDNGAIDEKSQQSYLALT